MKISIIIVLANRLSYLKMLLWNLFNYQNFDHSEMEIVIVDDGGIQDILSYLKQEYSGQNIKYIRTNRKERAGMPNVMAGRSIPTNLGIHFATGKIMLVCDSEDFMLEPNHLSKFCEKLVKPKQMISAFPLYTYTFEQLEFVKQNYQDPILIKEWMKTVDPINYYPKIGGLAPNNQSFILEINGKPHWNYRCSGYWAQFRKDFIEIGGFNEKAWGMAGDDYETSYRFDNDGFTYIPSDLCILHNYHGIDHGGDMPTLHNESLAKEDGQVASEFFEQINNRTMQVHILWDPKFYDDDIYINLKEF